MMKPYQLGPSHPADGRYASFSPLHKLPPTEYGTLSSVPIARPVHHNDPYEYTHFNHQHSEEEDDEQGCCRLAFKLVTFNVMNAILGLGAFPVVLIGLFLSIALLPVCCLGLVVFRLLLYAVRFLAQTDVELHNYGSPPEERVCLGVPNQVNGLGMKGYRFASDFSSVSPRSLMAVLYFTTVKLLIGLLSCFIVVSVITLPTIGVALAALGSDGDAGNASIVLGKDTIVFSSNPIGFSIALLYFVLISVALLHLNGALSRKVTRFICCERTLDQDRYAQAPQLTMAEVV